MNVSSTPVAHRKAPGAVSRSSSLALGSIMRSSSTRRRRMARRPEGRRGVEQSAALARIRWRRSVVHRRRPPSLRRVSFVRCRIRALTIEPAAAGGPYLNPKDRRRFRRAGASRSGCKESRTTADCRVGAVSNEIHKEMAKRTADSWPCAPFGSAGVLLDRIHEGRIGLLLAVMRDFIRIASHVA